MKSSTLQTVCSFSVRSVVMCNHIWNSEIKSSYYDQKQYCRAEKVIHTCIFCGKTRKETVYVKDPPSKRKLPKFIKDDLSNV